ncbi:MAG: hypothetical protein KF805_11345 [Phycisphaeraceae bacterium]|nr:hypothetical protein [Phycisphaeraceae bacterium]
MSPIKTAFALSFFIALAAHAQVAPGSAPYNVSFATGDVSLLAGNNGAATGTNSGNKFSAHFGGDLITQVGPGDVNGKLYSGNATSIAIIPFTIGNLPVRINTSNMKVNFKLVASGGTGFPGDQDPVVTVSVGCQFRQRVGTEVDIFNDPDLGLLDFSLGTALLGNGLNIINQDLGTYPTSLVLTPGNYYLFAYVNLDASYYGKGYAVPTRGGTVEFGGDLSGAYKGLDYSFEWETVPAPGAASLLGAGLMLLARRRRR